MPAQKANVAIAPEALDPAIASACASLVNCVKDVERVRSTIDPLLDQVRARLMSQLASGALTDDALITVMDELVGWLNRYSQTSLNLTRIADEAARLRSFLAGGADSRPDLSALSDTELAALAKRAVVAEVK